MTAFNKGWKVKLQLNNSLVEMGYEVPWIPRYGDLVRYNNTTYLAQEVEWDFNDREVTIHALNRKL